MVDWRARGHWMQPELTQLSLAEAAEHVQHGRVSPVELVEACLRQIRQHNPILNAFITLTAESALAEAAQAEHEIQQGRWRGPLHGIPLALKDNIDQQGVRTTAASAVMKDNLARHDAEVTRRLRQAGAVFLGKLNLHEFAYGGSGLISYFGPVRNPWDTGRITGGSSSGGAAAVATGMCYAAIGTDTAGSIRLPAACCGIIGLKPSFGLVSRRGVVPLSLSLDHAGPMTRTVEDAAIVLDAIAGHDAEDGGSCEFPPTGYYRAIHRITTDLRVGLAVDYFCADADSKIESELRIGLARTLAPRSALVCEVKIPVDEDRTVQVYEAYAYHKQFLAEHRDHYQPETLRRILTGKNITQDQYELAKRKLEAIRRGAADLFREIDLLITPTVPVLPPTFAEMESAGPEQRHRELTMLRNTRPFNVLGLPAITVPCGFTPEGLPIGMQIGGRPGEEDKVLAAAYQFQRFTEWHRRLPPILEPASAGAE